MPVYTMIHTHLQDLPVVAFIIVKQAVQLLNGIGTLAFLHFINPTNLLVSLKKLVLSSSSACLQSSVLLAILGNFFTFRTLTIRLFAVLLLIAGLLIV